MEIAHWQEYRNAAPGAKNAVLERILRDNEGFIAANVRRLMRRGLVSPKSAIAESPLEDLMQAGRVGYIAALDKFEPEKGAFPSYAKHWIRHEVQQAAIGETTIRKPKDSGLPYATLKKMDEIRVKHGREATAEELGLTEEKLGRWRTEPVVSSYQEDHAAVTTGRAAGKVGDDIRDGGADLLTTKTGWLSDEDVSLNPEQLLGLKDLRGSVERLPDLERRVIEGLFFTDKTVSQLLAELRISCSTMYTVRDAALAKLREEV